MRSLSVLAGVLLLLTPTGAGAEWRSLQSDNFRVIGDATNGQLRDVALRLEQFREVMRQLNPTLLKEGSAPPIVVYVFRDMKTYEQYWPQRNLGIAGLFIPGRDTNVITLSLESRDEAYPTIFHEFSHVLLRNVVGDAPIWFNEGLAEYYSTLEVTNNGRTANIGKPIGRHVQLLRERRLPFTRFFSVGRDSPEYTRDSSDRAVLYAQSWAIVHHAFHGESGRNNQLLSFVAKVIDGGPTDVSFRAAYGMELRDLEREVQLYVQSSIYGYRTFTLNESVLTRITANSVAISDAESEAWLGSLLTRMGRRDEGVARIQKALAADPTVAVAHTSLGLAELRDGNTTAAIQHLRRAADIGTDESAFLVLASALLSQAAPDDDSLREASRALEGVLKIRPAYNEAKVMLASTQLVLGGYTQARDLLAPVVETEPNNHRAALLLAEAHLRLGDVDRARTLIGPVLARSADETEKARARTLLTVSADLLNRRNPVAAANPASTPPPTGAPPSAAPTGPPAAAAPSAGPGAPSPIPLSSLPRRNTLALRQVGPGEQRVSGVFEAVVCTNSGVAFVVRTADAVVSARAARISDVELVTFRPLANMTVNCGPQASRFPVYLTFRPPSASEPATAEPTAIAIELLPDDFQPQ